MIWVSIVLECADPPVSGNHSLASVDKSWERSYVGPHVRAYHMNV